MYKAVQFIVTTIVIQSHLHSWEQFSVVFESRISNMFVRTLPCDKWVKLANTKVYRKSLLVAISLFSMPQSWVVYPEGIHIKLFLTEQMR